MPFCTVMPSSPPRPSRKRKFLRALSRARRRPTQAALTVRRHTCGACSRAMHWSGSFCYRRSHSAKKKLRLRQTRRRRRRRQQPRQLRRRRRPPPPPPRPPPRLPLSHQRRPSKKIREWPRPPSKSCRRGCRPRGRRPQQLQTPLRNASSSSKQPPCSQPSSTTASPRRRSITRRNLSSYAPTWRRARRMRWAPRRPRQPASKRTRRC